ncbi:Serine phosphatase RsbU, regulator of sigma subunit [Lentzea xinjiangensis]|uniref:Serine phosphatase RsbU, regulator of sigma subunit n=1 Tax=Lentzea xinjiangensis TaxID=402600 RepID=A0A1H9JWN5_9PSEU|nr:PP2C family protein-serine/threonine phosphatase [Lentzea xinjiangensis]SEQ91249.1 Serine phosphatase RsbU, regulator of sigma subunit [Lentzea xinjiangensis]
MVAVQSWLHSPCPAIVVNAAGVVHSMNDAAKVLLPADIEPRWQHGDSVLISERSYAAHRVDHSSGEVTWWLLDDTDLRLERHRAELLTRMSTVLMTSLNPERCMRVVAELASTHLADDVLVIAPGTTDGHPVTRCVRGEAPTHELRRIDVEEVVGLSEALRGFPPVPSRWIDPAAAPGWLAHGATSIVVTPLPGHGVPAGALILMRRDRHFAEDEEAFARLFASRAGVAMSAAWLFTRQAAITERLTRDLLPPVLRRYDSVDLAGRYRAAQDTEQVGGDFYDVHERENGELFVVLGDVCGKGLDAAVQTGQVRTTVHALLPVVADHDQLLRSLNKAVLTTDRGRFITVVVATVKSCEEGLHVRLTSGGHPPALIVRANGEVRAAKTRGTLVGLLPEIVTTTDEVVLAPGDSCLLHTDGITEAVGGPLGDEEFGEERLLRALEECGGMPAEALVEHVHMLAAQWIGSGTHDDMAVVAITAPRRR